MPMRIVLRAVLTDVPYVLSTQLGILPREATPARSSPVCCGPGWARRPPTRPDRDGTGADRAARSAAIRAELRGAADPARAPQMQAYMKSTMPYLGVPLPVTRRIARRGRRRAPAGRRRRAARPAPPSCGGPPSTARSVTPQPN